jgi:hypothetical protein
MSGTAAMTHHAAVELAVTRFFQMLNSHCPGNLAPLMTTDVELIADEEAAGQEAANAFFIRLWEAYPCISFVVRNVIINETGAAAEVTYANGPKGTGERCFVFQFKGEKIRRVRCY